MRPKEFFPVFHDPAFCRVGKNKRQIAADQPESSGLDPWLDRRQQGALDRAHADSEEPDSARIKFSAGFDPVEYSPIISDGLLKPIIDCRRVGSFRAHLAPTHQDDSETVASEITRKMAFCFIAAPGNGQQHNNRAAESVYLIIIDSD